MKNKIFTLLLLTLLFGCGDKAPEIDPELQFVSTPVSGMLPYFKGKDMDPYWPENKEKSLPLDLKRMPETEFVSHLNAPFNRSKLSNHYTFVTFFYAKCSGVCPMITRNMIHFLPRWNQESEVQLISITINPQDDNVENLISYRRLYKINESKWFHLTGKKAEIYSIARDQFGADVTSIDTQNSLKDFVHTENLYLLDKDFYLRGVYRVKGPGDLDRLITELNTLKTEDAKKQKP
jgi:protein SCO1/2